MPCSKCDHTLIYHEEKHVLFCPACLHLPVADKQHINEKARMLRDQYLNTPEFTGMLEEFGAFRVITGLVNQLNAGAYGMLDENRMEFNKFFTSAPIVKAVYERGDQFDHHFNPDDTEQTEVHDRIHTITNDGTTLLTVLEQIQEDLTVPIEFTTTRLQWTDFFGNHEFPHSEYWWCSERCLQATIGGRDEIRDEFLDQRTTFRSFTRPDTDNVGTVQDYADAWYGFIVSMGFSATLDDALQNAFTTNLPDHVSIFDIEALFENVDETVSHQLQQRSEGDYRPLSLDESEFDECGEDVFGSEWENVKSRVLVSEDTVDAHPFFFQVTGTQDMQLPNWRRSRTREFNLVLYPDYFSKMLKFQVFPLLENGELDASVDVLPALTAKRGLEFERHVFEYLRTQGLEAYHSCETASGGENEVDVIFVKDDSLFFVEVKFVLPTLNMQTERGIQDVNETFDEKIFQDGPAFDEKVNAWTGLDQGFEFTHQEGPERGDRVTAEIPSEWRGLDVEMLVVSNFVPSYLEKRGIRFITDLELLQWIEYDEDVFIDVLKPTLVSY